MRCPRCDHDNPEANKFCAECGAELVVICPSCSTPNPPTSKFCGECGSALREAAPAAGTPTRAEQRLVSVLFADLVGFTPFSESRDSEEVRDMLTRYFDRARDIVDRFGGTVDKFIGDAVMAVWGAVGAQEDDAERSVRAALELVDMVTGLGVEIGVPDLSLRAGVMTGETSVGPGGNEKGLVVGDLVNTASRLESIAEPGAVLVGEPTHALTRAAIQFDDLGEQSVKGKEDAVHAFRALRVMSERGGARRAEGLEAPFAGRDLELRMLKDQFHATGRDKSARLVSVIGQAGIGKSRLSWELEKYIDGLAVDVYWHRGRSPSYGDGLTMWALGEMVRRRAGIVDADDPAKSRMKLRTAVAEYVSSEDDRSWLEPRLAALLGLDSVPTGDKDELYGAFRAFFQHISTRGTTALIFEDMHWADDGLLDFVEQLVERSPRHPIFVVTLARPELLETRPGWGSAGRNSLSLNLAPLSDEDMMSLVMGMVPGVHRTLSRISARIPEEAAGAIVARAGGIPLYAVEFVRMLVSSGELVERDGSYELESSIEEMALPESLQAVVGARVDRLSPGARELLQDASVLGHSFRLDGMTAIRETDGASLRESLDGLVRQQLIEIDDDPRSPERGQYRFVQSVIREVAYGRLSKADRFTRHLKVAQYFEGLEDTELVGAVASHYLAAHEAAPQGEGEGLLERGRTALSDAASRAADLQSHMAALSLLEQAIVLAQDPTDRAALLERASFSAAWSSANEKAIELAAEAARLYEEVGDEQGRLRSITLHAFTLDSNFRADEAVALLRPVYDSIDDPSTVDEVALALETARAHMLNQEYPPAVEITELVLAKAEAILEPHKIVDGLITRATALGALGRRMESLALLDGAISLADQHELQAQAIRALNNYRYVRAHDAPLVSIEDQEEFLARARRFGVPVWVTRAMNDSVGVMHAHGKLDRAEDLLAEMAEMPLPDFERTVVGWNRAYIEAVRDESPEALEQAFELASTWDGTQDPQLRAMAEGLKATVRAMEGDLEATFDHAMIDKSPTGIDLALFAAIALQDAERIERVRELSHALSERSRLTAVVDQLADAGLAAIRGDISAASAGFVDGLQVLAKVHFPFMVNTFKALFRGIVGEADPAAVRAGEEARAWMREAGMAGLEAALADWLPPEEPVAVETA